jgi:hypothetical protein
MKILSFSIFDHTGDWQFLFYMRGLFFNCAMARIVYPEFEINIMVERSVYIKYREYFIQLSIGYGAIILPFDDSTLCMNMLWRMAPVFLKDNEYVFPRDADSLITFREAQAVRDFIESGKTVHGLHDNPAHSLPLLGGMCGFKCQALVSKYGGFGEMLNKYDAPIDKRGSDQDFLNRVVYQDFKESVVLDYNVPRTKTNPLWLSDLCVFFIGAAGCNEFETLRYLRDNGTDLTLGGVAKQYPKIFYWA